MNNLGMVHSEECEWEAALNCFGRAMTLAEAAGDTHTRTAVLNNTATLHLARGEFELAREACEASIEGKAQVGETPGIGIALATMAGVQSGLGNHVAALEAIREAIALLDPLGQGETLCEVYCSYGELLLMTGETGQAWPILRKAIDLAENTGRLAVTAKAYRVLSEIYRLNGQPQEALSFASEAMELGRFLPRPLELARSIDQTVRCGGDPAGTLAQEAAELRSLMGLPATKPLVS